MTTPQFNFFGDVSLGGNKLKDVVLETPSAPAAVNGQIFLDSTNNTPSYYDAALDTYISMSSNFAYVQSGTSTGVALIVGSGSSLTFNDGTINANLFNGATKIDTIYGGTNRSILQSGAILFGDGTNAVGIDSTGLYYDNATKRLAIRSATASGAIHIGTGIGPLVYFAPTHLTTIPYENTLEFNGTGIFLTDNFGIRYHVATTGMSINSFPGTLSMSRGGTNTNSLSSGSPITSNGSSLLSVSSFSEWNIHNPSGYTVSLNYINGSGNAFYRFPRSTGYIATSRVPYTTGFAYWNGTGILIATGVNLTIPANVAYRNSDNTFSSQTFGGRITMSSGVGIRFGDGTNVAYVTLLNQGVDTDYTAIFPTKSDGLQQTLMVTRSNYSSGHFVRFNGLDFIAASGDPTGSIGSSITNNQKLRSITASFVGTPISSGQTSFTRIPYSGTIQKWSILGTPTGSLQLNIYCTGFAAWPTTSSIAATSLPLINSDRKAEDSVLTGWKTAVASGDVIDIIVASGNNLINQLTFVMDILVT